MCTYILHVYTYVQNLNLLLPKLWHVVQFTEQWANKLTNTADNNYNNYNDITLKRDQWSSAELKWRIYEIMSLVGECGLVLAHRSDTLYEIFMGQSEAISLLVTC